MKLLRNSNINFWNCPRNIRNILKKLKLEIQINYELDIIFEFCAGKEELHLGLKR